MKKDHSRLARVGKSDLLTKRSMKEGRRRDRDHSVTRASEIRLASGEKRGFDERAGENF